MIIKPWSPFIAFLAVAVGAPAWAARIRLDYTETVTALPGVNPFAQDGLAVGDRLTIGYAFDKIQGDAVSTPYHAVQNTPSGPIDYGYFGTNEIVYSAPGVAPVPSGAVQVTLRFDGKTVALSEIDFAQFYATGQPGAEGNLTAVLGGLLADGTAVQLTDSLNASGVTPLLTAPQSVTSDGHDFPATIGTATGAVIGTLDTAMLTAVPEPATWSLIIAGVGGLGGLLRRRVRFA